MWQTKKLNEVCDIQSGLWKGKKEPYTKALVLRNTNFTASGVFDYSNVVELEVEAKQLATREVLKNDIILEKSGGGDKTPVGRVCIHDKESEIPFSFSNFTARIRVLDSKELNAEFLHKFLYFLYISGKTEPMQRHSTGIRNLQLTQYKDIDVPLPPLAEQERIVAKLDAAFAEIDRAIISSASKETEIQKLKTSLLRSSLNGDDIMWKKVKISDVCQIQPKKAQVKLKLKDSDEVSFMPMKDLGIQTIYPKSNQIKKLEKVYSSYTYFEDNDILLAKITPCFENGKLGIASNLINGVGFGSSEYIVLRCSEEVIPQYIYFCLNQPNFRIIGENQMSGAVGHKRVPIEYVENTEIYLPPIADQERIVAKLDAANTEFRNANEAIAKSKVNYLALKSAILSQELKSNEAA